MTKFYSNKIKKVLRPGYYFYRDVFDFAGKKRLSKNIVLKDVYKGKRGFLLLTGESLQHIDVKKLKKEYTYGAGYIFFHEDVRNMDLNFYMSADLNKIYRPGLPQWPAKQLGPLTYEGIAQFYRAVDKAFTNKTTLLLNSENYKDIELNNVFKDKTIYFFKVKKDLDVDERISYAKIADLTKRKISGGGAIFFSILVMMYLGFKEIYLCGVGYTYEPAYVLHFYDNFVFPKSMGRVKAEIEARKAIDIRNKKILSNYEYYGLFEKDDLYRGIYTKRMGFDSNMDKHRILNDYARSQGVKIYNIVPEGFKSPVYEKITWEEDVSNVLQTRQNTSKSRG